MKFRVGAPGRQAMTLYAISDSYVGVIEKAIIVMEIKIP